MTPLADKMITSVNPNPWLKFRQCHWILRAYVVFAVLASALFLSGLFTRQLDATIMPLTGGTALMFYMFTLHPAIVTMLTPHRNLRKQIYLVAVLLGLAVFSGGLDAYWHIWGYMAGASDYGNPYLIYHPARPAITVALPALWLALLFSPSMRRWIKNC